MMTEVRQIIKRIEIAKNVLTPVKRILHLEKLTIHHTCELSDAVYIQYYYMAQCPKQ